MKALMQVSTGWNNLLRKMELNILNDSKSINLDALNAPLRAVGSKKNVCLIAGGLDKNMDFLICF